jgi:hypothetical protein
MNIMAHIIMHIKMSVYYQISTVLYNACVACGIKCPDFADHKAEVGSPEKLYASIGVDVYYIGLLCDSPVNLNMCTSGDLSAAEKMQQTAGIIAHLISGIDTRLIIVYCDRGIIQKDMTRDFRKWWTAATLKMQSANSARQPGEP